MRQEVQKFELLGNLQKKAKSGRLMIDEVLSKTIEKDVDFCNAIVDRQELKNLRDVLSKAESAEKLADIRNLLKEEIIPLELVITSQFWREFQVAISSLHKKIKKKYDFR